MILFNYELHQYMLAFFGIYSRKKKQFLVLTIVLTMYKG